MRDVACQSWVAAYGRDEFVFLTGDLGFNALEPLRDVMGERFINAGVAEQNMISVAAGLASQGLSAWAYSIAPFTYARPFEQIRNDLALHGLPVKLVGNGGGYAYGPMGATHHALEDYGVLLTLQGFRVFVPAFGDDVGPSIAAMNACEGPSYLRLGRCEKPTGEVLPAYASWRRLRAGAGPVVIVCGPLVGGLLAALDARPELDAECWVISELPLAAPLPAALGSAIERAGRLLVVEEHVAAGGVGAALARALLIGGIRPERFEHACAQGYPSGRYGSQAWHRSECGLDAASLVARVAGLAEP